MNLYYYNPSLNYLIINSIKINKVECTLIGSDVISGSQVTQVDVSGCNVNKSLKAEVAVITSKGIFSKYMNVK